MAKPMVFAKRFFSIAFCFVLIAVCVPCMTVETSAAEGGNCTSSGCSGTYSNGFCSANSSHYESAAVDSNGTYQIGNAGQLYWFASLVDGGTTDANAVLTADITDNVSLTNSSGGVNEGTFRTWNPIGEYSALSFLGGGNPYKGTFDGQGHTISGLYNNDGDSNVGLFAYIDGGTVRNVGIVDSYFSGSYAGGIVGRNAGTVTNCYSTAYIDGSRYLGGIAGYNNGGSVTNCYATGTISGSSYLGGVVGRNSSGTVTNCFYLSGIADGGINSSDASGQAEVKTAEQFAGGEVAYLLQAANATLTWGQMSNVTGSCPILTSNEVYAVACFGNSDSGIMGYSVLSLGDVNNDRDIDIDDYQLIVNVALSDANSAADFTDAAMLFNRGDVTGDGIVDVLDVQSVWDMYFQCRHISVYEPGDFDGNGSVDSTDSEKIKQYISNSYFMQKGERSACDINGDGSVDDNDLVDGFGVSADDNYVFFDTVYGTHERHRFDLYIPKSKKTVGVVLMLHGGAWMGGDKSEYYGRLEEFAAKGYAGVSVNYRYISETVDLDDLMDDIEQAVALVKEIGDGLGVELSGFVSTGGSAGGHLALHYAYSRDESSAIPPKAVVSYCGPTDLSDDYYFYNEELGCYNGLSPGGYDTTEEILSYACGQSFTYETRAEAAEALKFVSPLYYVDENTVPTVINHGMVDDIVPFRNATNLAAKLREYGVTYVENYYPTSGHGLDADAENVARAEELFQEYVATYLDSVDK